MTVSLLVGLAVGAVLGALAHRWYVRPRPSKLARTVRLPLKPY